MLGPESMLWLPPGLLQSDGASAEEDRFEPLRGLLSPVKESPVNELGQRLRGWVEEEATKIEQFPVALAFFDACDAQEAFARAAPPVQPDAF